MESLSSLKAPWPRTLWMPSSRLAILAWVCQSARSEMMPTPVPTLALQKRGFPAVCFDASTVMV
jgi:hypothetical protein